MIVRNYMTKSVITVTPETPVKEIVLLMHKYKLQCIIIVSEDYKVDGIITHTDIFRRLLPLYNDFLQNESYWLNPEKIEGHTKGLMNKYAKDIMTKEPERIKPNMSLIEAGSLMIAYKIKQLPVVEDGKLIGVISYDDITWALMLKKFKFS